MRVFPDVVRRLAHVVERHALTAAEVQDQAACTRQGFLDERAFHRLLHGLDRTPLALADAEERIAALALPEGRREIGEIDIDLARRQNQFRDAVDRLTEDVVRRLERVDERHVLVLGKLHEVVVMYDDQGVKISLHLRDALIGDALLARTLKGKGHRHDADRQYAHVLGNFCDDGRRARARAAAHTRRDEYEVGALQNFLDFRLVALRRCFPEIRHAARAEPLRQLSSDGERLDARLFHIGKLLRIRIDRDQLHIKLVSLGYTLDDAVAAAAHADDLYRDYRSLDLRIIRYHGSGSPSLCLADPSLFVNYPLAFIRRSSRHSCKKRENA